MIAEETVALVLVSTAEAIELFVTTGALTMKVLSSLNKLPAPELPQVIIAGYLPSVARVVQV